MRGNSIFKLETPLFDSAIRLKVLVLRGNKLASIEASISQMIPPRGLGVSKSRQQS